MWNYIMNILISRNICTCDINELFVLRSPAKLKTHLQAEKSKDLSVPSVHSIPADNGKH